MEKSNNFFFHSNSIIFIELVYTIGVVFIFDTRHLKHMFNLSRPLWNFNK